MPRATGNDLNEIFGYAPDDYTIESLKQRASQHCPFLPGTICVKHSHPRAGADGENDVIVFGSCSVLNATRTGTEEVIICPQRLYSDNYATLKDCINDSVGKRPVFTVTEYKTERRAKRLPPSYAILFGQKSGKEVSLEKRSVISLNLDWVFACIDEEKLSSIIPCEVQSIDITGNYQANWNAYAEQKKEIPNSQHGMNWANVWKRLIPQLILKGMISKHSLLSKFGTYFVVPDRVYKQFENLIGDLPVVGTPGPGVLNIVTYALGDNEPQGKIRKLKKIRQLRVNIEEFSKAFGSGAQVVSLGPVLDQKIRERISDLQAEPI